MAAAAEQTEEVSQVLYSEPTKNIRGQQRPQCTGTAHTKETRNGIVSLGSSILQQGCSHSAEGTICPSSTKGTQSSLSSESSTSPGPRGGGATSTSTRQNLASKFSQLKLSRGRNTERKNRNREHGTEQ